MERWLQAIQYRDNIILVNTTKTHVSYSRAKRCFGIASIRIFICKLITFSY